MHPCAQQLILGGNWQAAETLGDYSLFGCTVPSGFDFSDFRLLKDLLELAARINQNIPT